MKFKELSTKSREELVELEGSLREKLFKLEYKNGTRQLEDTSMISQTKKDIARCLTALNKS